MTRPMPIDPEAATDGVAVLLGDLSALEPSRLEVPRR